MKNKLAILLLLLLTFVSLSQTNHKIALQPCLKPFYHGVASGDPMNDKVIIWTRVTPDSSQINQTIVVNWEVALDTGMVTVVKSGVALTDSSMDFTVKVDVTGLNPNTFYFYEFKANNKYSPRGRTKTTPVGNTDSLRFALVSCANFEAGLFNVYASLLQRSDFDAVLSLGDYIYEYNQGGYSFNTTVNRNWQPANEILSIADYRMRYSSYKLDDDLQRLHQQFPFIIVYDDHELANDAWKNGAQNHTSPAEGPWNSRKQNAQKAFFEWLPIRQTSVANPYQIYRNIKYGNLVEFMMLDTRVEGRDLQAGTTGATVTSSTRQLLGTQQFSWLGNKLDSTAAQWKILGQQVMMAPLAVFGIGFNGDQWDGYPAERTRIYNHILTNNIQNVVVITGDIHSSWANDLPTASYNSSTGAGSAGVEFVTPSVTSPGMSIPLGPSAIMSANSHIKYCDLTQHGYIIMDIKQTRTQADWYYVTTIDNASTSFNYAKSFYVDASTRFLKNTTAATLPRNSIYYTKAPFCPRVLSTGLNAFSKPDILLSVYPNPTFDYITYQYNNSLSGVVTVNITDAAGKEVYSQVNDNVSQGVHKGYINTTELANGIYFIKIKTKESGQVFKFIKQ